MRRTRRAAAQFVTFTDTKVSNRFRLPTGWRLLAALAAVFVLGVAMPSRAFAAQRESPSTPVACLGAAGSINTTPSALRLADHASLRIPGNSRFAAELRGRDTVERHLAAMGIRWDRVQNTRAAFALGPNEGAWLVMVHAASTEESVLTLVAATHDANGTVTALELFVDDERRLARLYPRDDGIQRTSLAAQRNLQQVRAIHGTGGHTRFLAASRGRVLAILDEVVPAGHAPQLVQYRFDATGRVSSLHAVLPQGLSCCNSSGSNETFAFMITPP
jgi:hypothetical protein